MKVAVINFSGNVGKSTVARHLLQPRIPGAELIRVESINAGESQAQALRGRQFGELQEYLQTIDNVVVDIGASNVEDPRINFAISARGGKLGVDHLGIQTDTEEELVELKTRAQATDMALLDEGEATCRYARSDKYWLTDPQGIAWKQFHTLGTIPVFSEAAPDVSAAPAVPAVPAVPAAAEGAAAPGGCCASTAPKAQGRQGRAHPHPIVVLLLRSYRA